MHSKRTIQSTSILAPPEPRLLLFPAGQMRVAILVTESPSSAAAEAAAYTTKRPRPLLRFDSSSSCSVHSIRNIFGGTLSDYSTNFILSPSSPPPSCPVGLPKNPQNYIGPVQKVEQEMEEEKKGYSTFGERISEA